MTESHTPQISRRHLAEGVVWSAPVILMSTNAPVYAISPACTSLATTFGGAWTVENPASGTLANPPANKIYSGTDGVDYYAAMTTATSTAPAIVRGTQTLTSQTSVATGTLRAGCTYSMTYGLTAVPNGRGTAVHQVLTLKLIDPSGATVPGSQQTYTTATGVAGQTNVPYTTLNNLHQTLSSTPFTFTARAGTYKVIAEYKTPTNKGNTNLQATGLGFSSPKFTAV